MITRRHALVGGLAAIAARPAAASAADTDRGTLSALAAYQQAVAAEYDALLRQAGGTERRTLEQLRRRAAAASAVLPNTPAATSPTGASLARVIAAEEAFVAACYAALETLADERHIKGCGALMADAGRRLVVLRRIAEEPLLPRAFETGAA